MAFEEIIRTKIAPDIDVINAIAKYVSGVNSYDKNGEIQKYYQTHFSNEKEAIEFINNEAKKWHTREEEAIEKENARIIQTINQKYREAQRKFDDKDVKNVLGLFTSQDSIDAKENAYNQWIIDWDSAQKIIDKRTIEIRKTIEERMKITGERFNDNEVNNEIYLSHIYNNKKQNEVLNDLTKRLEKEQKMVEDTRKNIELETLKIQLKDAYGKEFNENLWNTILLDQTTPNIK